LRKGDKKRRKGGEKKGEEKGEHSVQRKPVLFV
jgi:hypothetical protein